MAVKAKARRRQVRRNRVDRSVSLLARLQSTVGVVPILLALVFFSCATIIALFGAQLRHFSAGQRTRQPVYSQVDFEVIDEAQTDRRKQAARAATPNHLVINTALITQIGTELQNLFQEAQSSETLEAFSTHTEANGWTIDQAAYDQLRRYADNAGAFEDAIENLKRRLASEYTWDPGSAAGRTPESTAEIVLVHSQPPRSAEPPKEPVKVSVFDVIAINSARGISRTAGDLAARSGFPVSLRKPVAKIVERHLKNAPLLLFDLALTNADMGSRDAFVEPAVVPYKRAQPLIGPRPDVGLTPADLDLLQKHDEAYRRFLAGGDPAAKQLRDKELLERVGLTAILLLTTVSLFIYVGLYQRRILTVSTRAIALVSLLIITLLATRLIAARAPIKELMFAPALFAASILAVVYSRRFAVGVMAIVSVMLCLTVRGNESVLVTLILGISATVILLKDIRTRTRFIWVGCLAAGVVFVCSMAFALVDGQEIGFAAERAAWAGGGALLSAMVTQASLPLIEMTFRIATPLTLLEWRDTTRPLLQRLAREAPGTYTHSLALGTMAEAACREINANGLLAQVGALYHDIGKIHKAAYFAENQEAAINRHDKLAPTMSLLIIIGHVKDGVEMAKEYKLPRVLLQFIAEHHGTTVVRYFHHVASEKQPAIASGKHDREVPEAQFRYPGPKPKSRESAVLMLCDGSESAVRALSEPTAGRIEQVVHQIVTDRLNDGQFDNCDITLRELHRVEESLVKSLCSQYHGRVAYPKAKESGDDDASPRREVPATSAAV